MRTITNYISRKYNLFASRADDAYFRILRFARLEDSAEVRISAAVATCMIIWYTMEFLQYCFNLFSTIADRSLTALVWQ